MDMEKQEWPEIIEETDVASISLQHTIVVSRNEFNERVGHFINSLINKGSCQPDTTMRLRRYILEFEITD